MAAHQAGLVHFKILVKSAKITVENATTLATYVGLARLDSSYTRTSTSPVIHTVRQMAIS